MAETGHFAALWKGLAERFKLEVNFPAEDWRRGAQPAEIEAHLLADRRHRIPPCWQPLPQACGDPAPTLVNGTPFNAAATAA
jgi:hypothetical protein